jgi:hypothetical protein
MVSSAQVIQRGRRWKHHHNLRLGNGLERRGCDLCQGNISAEARRGPENHEMLSECIRYCNECRSPSWIEFRDITATETTMVGLTSMVMFGLCNEYKYVIDQTPK